MSNNNRLNDNNNIIIIIIRYLRNFPRYMDVAGIHLFYSPVLEFCVSSNLHPFSSSHSINSSQFRSSSFLFSHYLHKFYSISCVIAVSSDDQKSNFFYFSAFVLVPYLVSSCHSGRPHFCQIRFYLFQSVKSPDFQLLAKLPVEK